MSCLHNKQSEKPHRTLCVTLNHERTFKKIKACYCALSNQTTVLSDDTPTRVIKLICLFMVQKLINYLPVKQEPVGKQAESTANG